MKRILKKIGLFNIIREIFVRLDLLEEHKILYQIGNRKGNNARFDKLMPQMIKVGDDFGPAPGVAIISQERIIINGIVKYRIEPIIIGDNVYIGSNAVILPGVTIGDNVIIGAGAIVSENIPSNIVVTGNPARAVCSVEDYMSSCKNNRSLLDVPLSWLERSRKKIPPKNKDIIEFQEYIMKQVKEREQKK